MIQEREMTEREREQDIAFGRGLFAQIMAHIGQDLISACDMTRFKDFEQVFGVSGRELAELYREWRRIHGKIILGDGLTNNEGMERVKKELGVAPGPAPAPESAPALDGAGR